MVLFRSRGAFIPIRCEKFAIFFQNYRYTYLSDHILGTEFSFVYLQARLNLYAVFHVVLNHTFLIQRES